METIKNKDFEALIPDYIELDQYKKNGGYNISGQVSEGKISNAEIININLYFRHLLSSCS